jgi:hypothetical protein
VSETIPGWDPVAAGKEAGERERRMRHSSPRYDEKVKAREYAEWCGAKADRANRAPPDGTGESLIPAAQRSAKVIGERFLLEVRK